MPTKRTADTNGRVVGVALASLVEPAPAPFLARSWNLYSLSFVSGRTTWRVVVASLPAIVVQLDG